MPNKSDRQGKITLWPPPADKNCADAIFIWKSNYAGKTFVNKPSPFPCGKLSKFAKNIIP
jgi:hypothetical protein